MWPLTPPSTRRGEPSRRWHAGEAPSCKHNAGVPAACWMPQRCVCVCVCVTGIGHINVLGPNPLTLPAVQSEENLAADGIPGRLRLASAMPVCALTSRPTTIRNSPCVCVCVCVCHRDWAHQCAGAEPANPAGCPERGKSGRRWHPGEAPSCKRHAGLRFNVAADDDPKFAVCVCVCVCHRDWAHQCAGAEPANPAGCPERGKSGRRWHPGEAPSCKRHAGLPGSRPPPRCRHEGAVRQSPS